MSQTPNTVIGIDIGKNSFHVVGHDTRPIVAQGGTIVRQIPLVFGVIVAFLLLSAGITANIAGHMPEMRGLGCLTRFGNRSSRKRL